MKKTLQNDEAHRKSPKGNYDSLPHTEWKLLRLKFLGRLKGGAGFPHNEQGLTDEEIPFFKVKDIGNADGFHWMIATNNSVSRSTAKKLGAYVFPRETIAFAKVGAALLLSRFRLLGQDSCIDNNLIGFMVNVTQAQPRFILYALSTLKFAEVVNPGAVPSLNEGQIGQLYLQIPPLKKQLQIADFLDGETSQIDALIKEKESMLSLLVEKRAALISRAVTRGLEPDVPLKSSGCEWLGNIPLHWEVRRCASIFKEVDERNKPDLPLLNVSLNTGVTVRVFSDNKIESVAADFASYKVARKGNLVFNKMRFWQGAVGIAPEDGLTSPDYTVAKFGPELHMDFVEALFRIPQFIMEVRRHSHGIVDDRLRLYWDGFKNICIPVPPLIEQKAIAEHLLFERCQTAEIEASLNKSIKLLKERRSALITAAVTGQIEIEDMRYDDQLTQPC